MNTEVRQRLTLASNSAIRLAILRGAGIDVEPMGSGVDEDAIKQTLRGAPVPGLAGALADAKTQAVAARTPGFVVGGDQILSLDGQPYDKVATMADARDRLLELKGRTHQLVGALSLAKDGQIIARKVTVSQLTMRAFTDTFLDDYLHREGDALLASVGCYRFEGLGAQLFSEIEGDYFSILGLDLLWLCDTLRQEGFLLA